MVAAGADIGGSHQFWQFLGLIVVVCTIALTTIELFGG